MSRHVWRMALHCSLSAAISGNCTFKEPLRYSLRRCPGVLTRAFKTQVMKKKMDFHEPEGHAKNLTLIKCDRRTIKMTWVNSSDDEETKDGIGGPIWNMTSSDGLQNGWSWRVAATVQRALMRRWRLTKRSSVWQWVMATDYSLGFTMIFTHSDCRGRGEESRPSAPTWDSEREKEIWTETAGTGSLGKPSVRSTKTDW